MEETQEEKQTTNTGVYLHRGLIANKTQVGAELRHRQLNRGENNEGKKTRKTGSKTKIMYMSDLIWLQSEPEVLIA